MGKEFYDSDAFRFGGFQDITLEAYLSEHIIDKVNKFKDTLKSNPKFAFLGELDDLKIKLDNLAAQDPTIESPEEVDRKAMEIINKQEQIMRDNIEAWDFYRKEAKKIIEEYRHSKLKGHSGVN
jgi:hypothetical protein